MKALLSFLTLGLLMWTSTAQAVEYKFASAEEGLAILLSDEAWFDGLGSAEIAIRMEAPVPDQTADDLKAMYSHNILTWTAEDIAAYSKVIQDQEQALAPFAHLLPDTVWFVKMSGRIEGGMPHTRKNAIFLPETGGKASVHLFLHELFHVLSRNLGEDRGALYNIIGFQPCRLEETNWMKRRRLSNPDVPKGGYYLAAKGSSDAVVPWLYADHDAFNLDVYGGFGGHFGFGLLSVNLDGETCVPRSSGDAVPVILSPSEVPEFFEAIGQNTGYIIHPEEVLADNFVFLVAEKQDLPNPEIVEKLRLWLTEGPKN